ncbi:MAG: helix-turn-helix domain-containing protein [Metallibacterium sp.]
MIRFKLKEQIAEKEFQEARRITLIEVADATGIGRITLSRMLKPGAVVRTDTLDALCAYFNCRLEDLAEFLPDGHK